MPDPDQELWPWLDAVADRYRVRVPADEDGIADDAETPEAEQAPK
jgi:hypothetical protein